MSGGKEPYDIPGCYAFTSRPKAICVEVPDEVEPIWVPKSVIHDDSEVYDRGHKGRLVVFMWWAEKQGMI